MSDTIHNGHRDRMRNKLMSIGLNKFQEHEMIEFLLFYGIPYKDTNTIAHNLIKKFGSLAGVFDASVEDLFEVEGMTKNAAILLHCMPEFFREYRKSKVDKKRPIMNVDDILPLLEANLHCRDEESLLIICLNASQRITAVVETGAPDIASVKFSTRTIADIALRYKAVNVIIAHNHPSDNGGPSNADIALTIDLKHMLKSIDVELVDHIIITNNSAYSFYLSREIREIDGCNITPYKMANKELNQLPQGKLVNIIKKEDGSFERLSK